MSDIKAPADKKPKQFIYFFGTENQLVIQVVNWAAWF